VNKDHRYVIEIISFRQKETRGASHVFAADHVDESAPKLVHPAKGQCRRREICRQTKPLITNLDRLSQARVNQAEAGINRFRWTPSAKFDY
jgi:hypothetical protein